MTCHRCHKDEPTVRTRNFCRVCDEDTQLCEDCAVLHLQEIRNASPGWVK